MRNGKASQRAGDEAGAEAVARAGCVDNLGGIAAAAPDLRCLIGVGAVRPHFQDHGIYAEPE